MGIVETIGLTNVHLNNELTMYFHHNYACSVILKIANKLRANIICELLAEALHMYQ